MQSLLLSDVGGGDEQEEGEEGGDEDTGEQEDQEAGRIGGEDQGPAPEPESAWCARPCLVAVAGRLPCDCKPSMRGLCIRRTKGIIICTITSLHACLRSQCTWCSAHALCAICRRIDGR